MQFLIANEAITAFVFPLSSQNTVQRNIIISDYQKNKIKRITFRQNNAKKFSILLPLKIMFSETQKSLSDKYFVTENVSKGDKFNWLVTNNFQFMASHVFGLPVALGTTPMHITKLNVYIRYGNITNNNSNIHTLPSVGNFL